MENTESPTCKACGKKFDNKESLNQHFNAKHYEKPKEIVAPKKRSYGKYIFWAALIILIGFIAWSLIPGGSNPTADYTPLLPQAEHAKGNLDSDIIMTEFSDFECPFCGRFFRDTHPQILSEYVDTNEIKFVYKHFPLTQIHNFAMKSAEASECAADQGKFWEMHDILFERQPQLAPRALKQYAEEIGLDTIAFNNCLDSGVMVSRVRADMQEALKLGVRSTPTFFINEQKIEGAQPFSAFEPLLRQ